MHLDLPDGISTYRAAARELTRRAGFNVSVGVLHRLAHGVEPREPRLRHLFGLPVVRPTPACPHCGQVHTAEVCTATPPRLDVHAVTVWTRRVRSGAVVLARSRRCARRRCGVHFVPVTPSQRYCSKACANRKRTKVVRRR